MKISKSKQELARIISENGGWRDGAEFSVSSCNGTIVFSKSKPKYTYKYGWTAAGGFIGSGIELCSYLKNWHQTILSRDEYFHLHPAPNAKPEFCESVMRSIPEPETKPTIEQLAADYRDAKDYAERKQQEADDAKADADAKLKALEIAGEALGLLVSPITAKQEAELVIHDWRDLQVGDIIECIGSWEREDTDGHRFAVTAIDPQKAQVGKPIRIEVPEVSCPGTWGLDFKFIRRP